MIAATIGNTELLKLHKTAFLCSRKISAGIVLKCYDWAVELRESGKCVISGFPPLVRECRVGQKRLRSRAYPEMKPLQIVTV